MIMLRTVGTGLVLLTTAFGAARADEAKLDKDEAKKAVEYLNAVRKDPASYSKEIGGDLKDVKALPALEWNDTLAKVAEAKALDMAKRNYYGHLTPEGLGINIMIHQAGYKLPDYMLADKKANFFESIAAGQHEGKKTIQVLVLDKGIKDLVHRKHLLGMDEFSALHKDVGVGFARAPKSEWKTYVCVIIAHQP
jgi:uncharacterized protein YkwD